MTVLGMDLGPHAVFIVASYAAGLVVVLGLIAWVVSDYATQRRLLDELEKQGVTRRSQGSSKAP